MEIAELGKAFFEKTDVTLARQVGGEFKEDTYAAFHAGFNEAVLKAWLEIENAESSDVPKVTQQLLASNVQVKEFTHEGKPVVMDAEKWAVVGIPVQRAIASQIWRATFGDERQAVNGEQQAEAKPKGKRSRVQDRDKS